MEEPSREELEAAHCWEPSDRVPGSPEMTAFRRTVRLHHARWREAHGHPIGTQPINPNPGATARPVGSRLPVDYARETGAAFVGPAALDAARARTATKEPHQTFDRQRLWADLLWAPALAVNLFAGADDRTVHRWWPDAPGTLHEIRFEHSPGRLDPAFLGNLSSLAAAFILDRADGTHDDGTQGVIGVRALHQEPAKGEIPKPRNLDRYREVAQRSGVFTTDGIDQLGQARRSDLTEIWLDHLLVLSMLQHESGRWTWGRLVVLHPAAHTQAADAAERYRRLLRADQTFSTLTLEDAIAARSGPTATALEERYLPT